MQGGLVGGPNQTTGDGRFELGENGGGIPRNVSLGQISYQSGNFYDDQLALFAQQLEGIKKSQVPAEY